MTFVSNHDAQTSDNDRTISYDENFATSFRDNQRLYLVTNGSLPHGSITAQTFHAGIEFAVLDFEAMKDWHTNGNTVVVLQTRNLEELESLRNKAVNNGFVIFEFHEPDRDNELTSIAFLPNENVQSFLKNLPLAHSDNSLQARTKRNLREKRREIEEKIHHVHC